MSVCFLGVNCPFKHAIDSGNKILTHFFSPLASAETSLKQPLPLCQTRSLEASRGWSPSQPSTWKNFLLFSSLPNCARQSWHTHHTAAPSWTCTETGTRALPVKRHLKMFFWKLYEIWGKLLLHFVAKSYLVGLKPLLLFIKCGTTVWTVCRFNPVALSLWGIKTTKRLGKKLWSETKFNWIFFCKRKYNKQDFWCCFGS